MTMRWTAAPYLPEPPDRRRRGEGVPPARVRFADCLRESWDAALVKFGGLALALATLAVIRALRPVGVLLLAVSQGSHL